MATSRIHQLLFPAKKDNAMPTGDLSSMAGVATWGKRLRKNSPTFGLSRLVRKPSLNAWPKDTVSVDGSGSPGSTPRWYPATFLMPRYRRYAAPATRTTLNSVGDVLMASASPKMASRRCTQKLARFPAKAVKPARDIAVHSGDTVGVAVFGGVNVGVGVDVPSEVGVIVNVGVIVGDGVADTSGVGVREGPGVRVCVGSLVTAW